MRSNPATITLLFEVLSTPSDFSKHQVANAASVLLRNAALGLVDGAALLDAILCNATHSSLEVRSRVAGVACGIVALNLAELDASQRRRLAELAEQELYTDAGESLRSMLEASVEP